VMPKKAAVLSSKVWENGIDGFAQSVENCKVVGQEMEMEVAGRIYQVGVVHQERALVFHEVGFTSLRNIVWHRFIAIRLRRPFIRTLRAFIYE
jgi:hypothetical protein